MPAAEVFALVARDPASCGLLSDISDVLGRPPRRSMQWVASWPHRRCPPRESPAAPSHRRARGRHRDRRGDPCRNPGSRLRGRYPRMLVGPRDVKPGRMVLRFIASSRRRIKRHRWGSRRGPLEATTQHFDIDPRGHSITRSGSTKVERVAQARLRLGIVTSPTTSGEARDDLSSPSLSSGTVRTREAPFSPHRSLSDGPHWPL